MFSLELTPLLTATIETLYMVFIASLISIATGLVLGSSLFVLSNKKASKRAVYQMIAFIINAIRSIPFIILMIAIIPLTRLIAGTTIGTNAAIVPLTIAAIPFYTRITETALSQVSTGLLEAANAMGASTFQTITKICIPESMPSLIHGATLTIIGLIGYSAMAGAIGGGGLGELAINYGYQRFDVVVMLETVVILIIMVQVIQASGDKLAKKRRIKPLILPTLLALILSVSYLVWPESNTNVLRIGVMSGWQEDVMQTAKALAQKDYKLSLKIIPFTDYTQPNMALANGSIDANIFQHQPFLDTQVKARKLALMSIGKTFVYPMGFYSTKIKTMSHLPYRGIVAIPNDPSNEARALLLLQKYGVITLKEGVSTLASTRDIVENPQQLRFKELDAAQLPRVLPDAELVAITNDFITSAKLSIQEALIKEDKDSPYANIIVIRIKDKADPAFNQLMDVMHSNEVRDKTMQLFPKGAAIPAW